MDGQTRTDGRTDRQTDRQIDRQTETERDRQTERNSCGCSAFSQFFSVNIPLTRNISSEKMPRLLELYSKVAEGGLGWGQNHRGGGRESPTGPRGGAPVGGLLKNF